MKFKSELDSWLKTTTTDLDQLIDSQAEEYLQLFKEFSRLSDKYKKKPESQQTKYKIELKEILDQKFESLSDTDLEKIHYKWWDHSLSLAGSLPATIKKEQPESRFKGKGKTRSSRFLKPFKIFFYKVNVLPKKLFSKKKPKYWKHIVPVQSLFSRHFYSDFLPVLSEVDELILKTGYGIAREIKEWEEQQSADSFKESVDIDSSYKVLKKEVKRKVKDFYEEKIKEFEADLDLAGTIEYDNARLRESYLRDKIIRNKKSWKSHYDGWANVSFALFEDWRSDLQISSLAISVNNVLHEFDTSVKSWLKTLETDHLSKAIKFVDDELEIFQKSSNKDISKQVSASRYRLRKELDSKILEPFVETLSRNSFLNMLDQLDYNIREQIKGLDSSYFVVKDGEKEGPYKNSDFAVISNYDLISFEMMPKMATEFEQIKNSLLNSINEWILQVGDLDEVITYSLNTAETIVDEEDGDPNRVIVEGIQRARKRLEDLKEEMTVKVGVKVDKIETILDTFCKDIFSLTDNENVRKIQFRISKAKAIEKSGVLRQRILERIKEWWRRIFSVVSKIYEKANYLVQRIRGNIIPAAASEENIRNVSDFVVTATEAVDKLPLIYRRLYAIEPLTDSFLFEGRTKEIDRVIKSYDSWSLGRYSASLIVGEKWSGLTTLINRLVDEPKFSVPMIRIQSRSYRRAEGMVLDIFSEAFEQKFKSEEEIIDYLNEGPGRIIILEDIQSLFIRRIGGMREMKMFLKIVAGTQKNIFWICTITLYAAHYLEKVVRISGFFSYVVKLETLTESEIRQVVLKRNRISGYDIMYEASEADHLDKKFRKLDEEGKQKYLEKKFFRQLNSFARSNISMALQYWLLSTKSIDQHAIIIAPYELPDFTFLAHLPAGVVHILHALILHDGLTLDQLKDVLHESKEKVQMTLMEMEEDGLITQGIEKFRVNTLIYRPVVQLLLSKNLLRS